MPEPFLKAGHRFEGPDGQAYELVSDVFSQEFISARDFRALGGAPEPEPGIELPKWLAHQIEPLTLRP